MYWLLLFSCSGVCQVRAEEHMGRVMCSSFERVAYLSELDRSDLGLHAKRGGKHANFPPSKYAVYCNLASTACSMYLV